MIKEVKDVRMSQDKKFQELLVAEAVAWARYKKAKEEVEEYYKNN